MNSPFLLICPSLRSLREKYIKKYYSRKPSVYKVTQLLHVSTTNTKDLCNYGKYLYYANKHRTLNVNNQN